MSTGSGRSTLRSVVGWLIVVLLAFWLLGIVIGTIRFVLRFFVWAVLLGLLIFAYFKLKDDHSDDP
jgi:hypothetical protein